MLFSVKDRIMLSSILPAEGNFRTMKTIQSLRTDLLFNEEEVIEFKVKSEGSNVMWDKSAEREVDIHIGEIGNELIVESLNRLDSENKLTIDHLDLWERFIGEK